MVTSAKFPESSVSTFSKAWLIHLISVITVLFGLKSTFTSQASMENPFRSCKGSHHHSKAPGLQVQGEAASLGKVQRLSVLLDIGSRSSMAPLPDPTVHEWAPDSFGKFHVWS